MEVSHSIHTVTRKVICNEISYTTCAFSLFDSSDTKNRHGDHIVAAGSSMDLTTVEVKSCV